MAAKEEWDQSSEVDNYYINSAALRNVPESEGELQKVKGKVLKFKQCHEDILYCSCFYDCGFSVAQKSSAANHKTITQVFRWVL